MKTRKQLNIYNMNSIGQLKNVGNLFYLDYRSVLPKQDILNKPKYKKKIKYDNRRNKK